VETAGNRNVQTRTYKQEIQFIQVARIGHQVVGPVSTQAPLENTSFGNVSQCRYLGTTVTNQNSIQDEIKMRLNSGNACYHSVQILLSSRLLSKNLKIRIFKKSILPVVLYGCET
jgi:hypothetical protein